jgi:hypothetical protein
VNALTAGAITAEAWQHVTELDFKTLRSLRALVVPGKLTAEFIAGHRRPYLSPMKVYLLCGAIFFLAAPYTGFTLESIVAVDRTGLIARSVEERFSASGLSRAHFEDRFELRFQSVYTASLVVSVAGVALLTALLFRAALLPAAAHAIFGLHYVSFLYLIAIPVGLLTPWLSVPSPWTLPILYSVLGPYLFFALRRVFAASILRTLLCTIVILGVTLVIDSLVNLMAFMLTLRLA